MKIIQKGNYKGDIISTTLENRSIEDFELFMNPENAEESNPLKFKNSKEGAKLLLSSVENKESIAIVVDSDADGYTSASIMYRYLNEFHEGDLDYIVQNDKGHGFTDFVMEEIKRINPDLIVMPDAGSNDVEQMEFLAEKEYKILIVDHHVVSKSIEHDNIVIVNNQLCEHTNKNLVGAGVVYKFLQVVDSLRKTDDVEKYLDLVAVGQIGDSSDISLPEVRKLVFKGLDNISNDFLKVSIGQENGFEKVVPRDLSFGVIPSINAVARIGKLEEREILFEAMAGIGDHRVFTVEKRRKDKTTGKFNKVEFNYSISEYAYDICSKVRNRQNNIIRKALPKIEESIVDDAGIVIAFSPEGIEPGLSGLIANKIVGKYDKPALLLNENEDTYTGSGRGHEKTLTDFRKWCEDSGLVEFAQGHDNAFGICIEKDKIDEFKEYSRNIEKQEVVYYVDILTSKPDPKDCFTVDKNKYLFGGSVTEPLIGIEKISVPKRFVSKRGSVLNIYSWGVGMIQFNSKDEFYDELMNYPDDNIILDVVGTYSVNKWSGNERPQLIIKDVEIVYNNNNDENEEITIENIVF